MNYLYLVTIFLIGLGAGAGAFFLVRLTSRSFKENQTIKGIGLLIVDLLLILIALINLVAGIGLLGIL